MIFTQRAPNTQGRVLPCHPTYPGARRWCPPAPHPGERGHETAQLDASPTAPLPLGHMGTAAAPQHLGKAGTAGGELRGPGIHLSLNLNPSVLLEARKGHFCLYPQTSVEFRLST